MNSNALTSIVFTVEENNCPYTLRYPGHVGKHSNPGQIYPPLGTVQDIAYCNFPRDLRAREYLLKLSRGSMTEI